MAAKRLSRALLSPVETEALAVARDWFDGSRELTTPEYSRAWFHDWLRMWARTNDDGMMHVVGYARAGDRFADDVVREMARKIVNREERLPTTLGAYVMDYLAGPGPGPGGRRGRKKIDNLYRDVAIVIAVGSVVARFGLSPTRNTGTNRNQSACSIVAKALSDLRKRGALPFQPPTAKAIESVWLRLNRSIFPRGPVAHNMANVCW
jgi:hypothetical protein